MAVDFDFSQNVVMVVTVAAFWLLFLTAGGR